MLCAHVCADHGRVPRGTTCSFGALDHIALMREHGVNVIED